MFGGKIKYKTWSRGPICRWADGPVRPC